MTTVDVIAIAGFTKAAGLPGVADVFAAVAVCDIPVVSTAAFDSVVIDVLVPLISSESLLLILSLLLLTSLFLLMFLLLMDLCCCLGSHLAGVAAVAGVISVAGVMLYIAGVLSFAADFFSDAGISDVYHQ